VATLPLLLGLFAAAIPVSLWFGVYPVAAGTVVRIALALASPWPLPAHGAWTANELVVVQVVRLPRVALAALAGTGLGLAGATLQGVFRNPLVGPDVIGISAGAACGAVLALLAGWADTAVMAAAFAGGMAALAAAALLARLTGGGGALTLVLAGVIVSAFAAAVISLAQFLANPDTQLPSLVYWLMGSFADADRRKVLVLAVPVLASGSALLALRWRMNLLSLGEADAAALGVRVGRLRWTLVSCAALIVAAQVSVSGIVGWVGLVVPHVARILVGSDHRRLLPASGVLGGLFTLLADDMARSFPAAELPIGVLMALVGTPVFAALLWRHGARGWGGD
jgi:iron complex transport system permease protein